MNNINTQDRIGDTDIDNQILDENLSDNIFEEEDNYLEDNNYDEIESTQDFTREEEINIAGLDLEDSGILVDEQFQIREDGATQLKSEENPIVRTLFISGILGVILVFLVIVWAALQPSDPTLKLTENPDDPNSTEQVKPEIDYRGKLALRDQQHQLTKEPLPNQQPITELPPKPTSQIEPVEKIPQPEAPKPRPQTVARVTPRTINRPTTPEINIIRVDPNQRWKNLSSFGEGANIETSNFSTDNIAFAQSNVTQSNINQNQEKTVLVSSIPTDGANGIINRRQILPKKTNLINYGTTIKAKIITPLVWDESLSPEDQVSNIFSVEMLENLINNEGETILEAGIKLLVKADRVNSENRLVNASVIAVHPESSKKLTIPEGKLILLDKKQQPLVAKAYFKTGATSFKTDFTLLALDSLGAVAEELTAPDTTSSTIINGNFSSTSTTTDNSDRKIWAAALEGADTLSERISRRATNQEKELTNRSNVSFLKTDTIITITAIDSFEIEE